MRFSDINGNADTLKALSGMISSGRIPHALMFIEPDGGPAFSVAMAYLQRLYCHSGTAEDSCGECPSCNRVGKLIHPDIHFVFPTTSGQSSVSLMPQFRALALENPRFTEAELGAALGIDSKSSLIPVAEAREVLSQLSLSALEGGWRSVVIYLPEKMNQEAANRLLKAIEEPEPQTEFILITHSPEKVLQTVASRCQRLQLGAPVKAPEFDQPELLDDLMDAIVRRDLYDALEAGERISALPSRESAKAFCKYASDAMRNVFLAQQKMTLAQTVSGNAAAWAPKLHKSFARGALAALDNANRMVERNVNMKIIFADLANKLYRING
ncbi:MAG: hypothetical protein J5737_00720 [Bacteroidales bacterium]|nr:hypothetical protein [Bacteroidales bacterium]